MSFFNVNKLALAISLLVSVSACGGAASAPAKTDTPPVVSIGTAGVFDIGYGQFSGIYTFLENGDFYGLHFVGGSTLAGHPHGMLSAANSITALEPIAWANFIDDVNQVGAQESAGKFGRTFSAAGLAVAISGSMGKFSAKTSVQKTYSSSDARSLYLDPLGMPVLAGSYSGLMRSAGIDMPQQDVNTAVIDGNGNFTATAAACNFSGKLVQHGATGIFDIQVAVGGSGCRLTTPLKGIVTPLAVNNNLPRIAVQLDSLNNAQTAVFILLKH